MEATKIKITPIELKNQKPTEVGECYLELMGDRFVLKLNFIAEEPIDAEDSTLGKESVKNSFTITVQKKFASGTEVGYTINKVWYVLIFITGSSDVKIYFRTEGAAHELNNKILDWLFK